MNTQLPPAAVRVAATNTTSTNPGQVWFPPATEMQMHQYISSTPTYSYNIYPTFSAARQYMPHNAYEQTGNFPGSFIPAQTLPWYYSNRIVPTQSMQPPTQMQQRQNFAGGMPTRRDVSRQTTSSQANNHVEQYYLNNRKTGELSINRIDSVTSFNNDTGRRIRDSMLDLAEYRCRRERRMRESRAQMENTEVPVQMAASATKVIKSKSTMALEEEVRDLKNMLRHHQKKPKPNDFISVAKNQLKGEVNSLQCQLKRKQPTESSSTLTRESVQKGKPIRKESQGISKRIKAKLIKKSNKIKRHLSKLGTKRNLLPQTPFQPGSNKTPMQIKNATVQASSQAQNLRLPQATFNASRCYPTTSYRSKSNTLVEIRPRSNYFEPESRHVKFCNKYSKSVKPNNTHKPKGKIQSVINMLKTLNRQQRKSQDRYYPTGTCSKK